MAGKKTPPDRRLIIKHNRSGWKQPITWWVEVLTANGVGNIQVTGKSRISFCCPFHQDKHPSAHIFLDSGKFRCFAATCDTTILDPFALIQRLSSISYLEAVEFVKKTAQNLDFIKDAEVKYLTEAYVKEKRMQLISDTLHDYLLSVWEKRDVPESTNVTLGWLRQVREITDPALINCLGMWPRLSDFKALFKGTSEDLAWAEKFLGPYFDNKYTDNVVFTNATTPTHISSFKIRRPVPYVAGKHEEVFIREQGEAVGFFGLANYGYKKLAHNEQYKNVIVVEGEFDQLALYTHQAETATFNEVIVSVSGAAHAGLNELADSGFYRAQVIGDDDPGGHDFLIGILEKTNELSVSLFTWPDELRVDNVALDPDEAVKRYGFDRMYKLFSSDKNYKFPPRWCRELAEVSLAHVNSEDVKAQEEIVLKCGSLIKDETELQTYCDLIVADYPLLTASTIFKNVRKASDTDIGFIHNIASWIKRKLLVLFLDSASNELYLFHKVKRVTIRVNLRSKQAAYSSFFQQIQGITIFEWARDEVGLPSYYPPLDFINAEDSDKFEKPGTKYVHNQIEYCLYEAFGLLVGDAPPRPAHFLSQGIHLEDIDEAGTPGYVVNGDRVYRLKWNEVGDNLNEVTELEGPVDGRTVFDLERRDQITTDKYGAWLPCVKNEKDFFARPKYSLKECYDLIYDIINGSSEFAYQNNDTQYCAYLVMYSYVLDSMQRRVMTHFKGEFESGKSSVLSLVSGGQQLWDYRLSYHAVALDNYTIAGIFQGFSGTKFMMGLDEANDTGDDPYSKIRRLLESFRGLATKGMADRTMGGLNQHARFQALFNAVVTASVTPIHDDMDASRFRTISLNKNPNKANTRVLLTKRYGVTLFEDLRKSIFLNIIRVAPAIARNYKALPVEFSAGTKHKLDRVVDGLLPLAAIAKYLDHDYISFIVDFCTNREAETELRTVARDGQSILDKILNIPKVAIMLPGMDKPKEMSLRTALRTEATRLAINNSECGVYYDSVEKAIGIAWEQARVALLQHDRSLHTSAKILKGSSGTTEHWINDQRAVQSGLHTRMMAAGLAGATIYSFFDISKYIKQIEDAMQEAEKSSSDAKHVKIDPKAGEKGAGGMNL